MAGQAPSSIPSGVQPRDMNVGSAAGPSDQGHYDLLVRILWIEREFELLINKYNIYTGLGGISHLHSCFNPYKTSASLLFAPFYL